MNNRNPNPITRELITIQDHETMTTILFGAEFELLVYPVALCTIHRIAKNYHSAPWRYWELSNQGFYMAPDTELIYPVTSDNGWSGKLSADALGIVVTRIAYGHYIWIQDDIHRRVCKMHHDRLTVYLFDHPEEELILNATKAAT